MIHVSIARSSEKLKELITKLVLVGDFNATQTAPTGAASNQKGEVSETPVKLHSLTWFRMIATRE